MINEWLYDSLKRKGIIVNSDGSLEILFFSKKHQHLNDVDSAIRQHQHIIDQQTLEQIENECIGKAMKTFHNVVLSMTKQTINKDNVEEFKRNKDYLVSIVETMERKYESLRKDGCAKLRNVLVMLDKRNLPAANLASQAALDRMRKRWLVNQQVIEKCMTRIEALRQLKDLKTFDVL